MEFLQPGSLAEAVETARRYPDAVPIAGGTDVMVDMNFARRRPPALLDLTRVPELTRWEATDGLLRVGAGVSYATLISELGGLLPGLAMASRTVGSPQIRNRGTLGGNLGSASPAGDTLPVLLASGAVVETASAQGPRRIPAGEFCTGVKQNALRPGELIAAVLLPPAPGPQQFCKVGTRNAMVIAVASFAVELDPERRRVGTGIGSAAPTPRRAPAAEEFLAGVLTERGLWERPAELAHAELDSAMVDRFGELAAAAAAPIDDVRGTAAYRTHALAVMARRALRWAWDDYTRGDRGSAACA
jgi:CO/xanthine dehydrogenase FAD-binding subunit